ncbi:hypothetical protein V6N00_13935 [Tersicoccus sp. MR15.9]|uniref:hypothetical protein n=1 Tax=Tersicoccus mangrovi TaxID=3121635 RepID=UPI002FE62FCB
MKTLDPDFLTAPPADGAPAVVTIDLPVAAFLAGKDPDTARPAATVTVTGPTYATCIAALANLGRQGSTAIHAMVGAHLQANDRTAASGEFAVLAAMLAVHNPYRVFEFEGGLAVDGQPDSPVKLTVTAPSGLAAAVALRATTNEDILFVTAANLCPETNLDAELGL